MSVRNFTEEKLRRTVDPRPVAIVRILYGLLAAAFVFEVEPKLGRALNPDFFQLPTFQWLPEIPSGSVPLFLGLWVVSALLFAAGAWTRAAGSILTALIAYLLLLDRQLYSNHLYLLALVTCLLTVAQSGAFASVDSMGNLKHRIPEWPVFLLKSQVTIVYGFAAFWKVNETFLSGTVLDAYLRKEGFLAIPASWKVAAILVPAAWLAVLTEGFLAAGLWFPSTRRLAFALGLAFHGAIAVAMLPWLGLSLFGAQMLALYLLFLDSPGTGSIPQPGAEQS